LKQGGRSSNQVKKQNYFTLKKMKKLLTILCLFLALIQAKAQDIIVKNDKIEIKAKIEEITETTIKYKKIDMLDGPTYNINKRDVFMIIYKNGSKEYMEATVSPPQPVVTQAPQPVQETRPANNNNQGGNGNYNNQNNNRPNQYSNNSGGNNNASNS
jgi:hypothetical protein